MCSFEVENYDHCNTILTRSVSWLRNLKRQFNKHYSAGIKTKIAFILSASAG
jgi:hypothetical protein